MILVTDQYRLGIERSLMEVQGEINNDSRVLFKMAGLAFYFIFILLYLKINGLDPFYLVGKNEDTSNFIRRHIIEKSCTFSSRSTTLLVKGQVK